MNVGEAQYVRQYSGSKRTNYRFFFLGAFMIKQSGSYLFKKETDIPCDYS